jgi:hypothetical protein
VLWEKVTNDSGLAIKFEEASVMPSKDWQSGSKGHRRAEKNNNFDASRNHSRSTAFSI